MAQVGESSANANNDRVGGEAKAEEEEDVDAHGIPTSVKHFTQNQFNSVWNYIHKLRVPIPDPLDSSSPFTHICLVCADEALNTNDPAAVA
ncbi:hypothetical protein L917_01682 [Phytophthora nicotianae]|uniref:Uncharacterized protein n=1 Tax=Phytophthora nicotianae TaxID=4792 RepID=W2LYN0_PHYNI|nr:hypothetical protein L917_01682 [Phytophthora nicotianae]